MMETLKLSGGFVGLPDSEATVPIAINELAIGGIDFISKEMEFNSGDLFSLVLVFLNGQTKLSCFVQRAQVTNVRMVEKERVVYSTFNNGLDKTAFQTIVNWVMQGREMEDGEDVEILDGDEVEEVTDTEEDTTDPFVQTLTGNPPARAVQLPRFPEQPGGLGSVVPKGGERYIETLVIDRSRALGVPELEIPILPPLPERPPDMILKASGSIRPRGESSVSQAPAGNLDEELGRAVDAWQTATGAAVDVLDAQILIQAPTTSSVLPTVRSGNENREGQEVAVAATPTNPSGAGHAPTGEADPSKTGGPPTGGHTSISIDRTRPPPGNKPRRWAGVLMWALGLIMGLIFSRCGVSSISREMKPDSAGVYFVAPGKWWQSFEAVTIIPTRTSTTVTLAAHDKRTLRYDGSVDVTVSCSPLKGTAFSIPVTPGMVKVVGSGTSPDLVRDVATKSYFTVDASVPSDCAGQNFQAMAEAGRDYVAAANKMYWKCRPAPMKKSPDTTALVRPSNPNEEVGRGVTIAGANHCDRDHRPTYDAYSGSANDIVGIDVHVRAQGRLVGEWCRVCNLKDCVAQCQNAAENAKLDRSNLARFQDDCNAAARPRVEEKKR